MAEDNGFLEAGDLQLEELNKESSTKSNILLFGKNFKTLKTYLTNLKNYLIYLRDLINIDSLINQVIETFQNSKISLPIANDMALETSINIEIGNMLFVVNRVSQNRIEITNGNDAEWNVDRLMITIKNNDGVVVYPKIITKASKITIEFNDGIISNYNIIII